MLIRIVAYSVAGYLILCLIFYFGQNRLLYFPDTRKPDVRDVQSMNLAFWPAEDDSFRGYLCMPDTSETTGLIIVFHGNAGAAWQRDYYCKPLGRLGYIVLLAEYPGYGGRFGKPSEQNLVRDARETIRLIQYEFPGPVYVLGESLGAAVVASALTDSSLIVDGVCLITPWARLKDLGQKIYPFVPVQLLARDQYDSIKNLAHYKGRIAVAVAEQDEVVSTEQGLDLFDSIQTAKKLWLMKTTSHNTWMFRVSPSFWQEIMVFLESDVQNQ